MERLVETDNEGGSEHVDLLSLCTPPSTWIAVRPGVVQQQHLDDLTCHRFDQAPVLHPDHDDPIGIVTLAYLRDLANRKEPLSDEDPVMRDPAHFVHTVDKVDVELPFTWLADRQAVLVDWSSSGWS